MKKQHHTYLKIANQICDRGWGWTESEKNVKAFIRGLTENETQTCLLVAILFQLKLLNRVLTNNVTDLPKMLKKVNKFINGPKKESKKKSKRKK